MKSKEGRESVMARSDDDDKLDRGNDDYGESKQKKCVNSLPPVR